MPDNSVTSIPWFGARRVAKTLAVELAETQSKHSVARAQLAQLAATVNQLCTDLEDSQRAFERATAQLGEAGLLTRFQLQQEQESLARQITEQTARLERER